MGGALLDPANDGHRVRTRFKSLTRTRVNPNTMHLRPSTRPTRRFVQWISHTLPFLRMLFGTLVQVAYLVLLSVVRPHKRKDVRMMALGVQTATVLIFLMAQSILFFTMLDEVAPDLTSRVLGVDSIDHLVATVIAVNMGFFVAVAAFTVYQTLTNPGVQVVRLVSSREVPELSLKDNHNYHLLLAPPGFEPLSFSVAANRRVFGSPVSTQSFAHLVKRPGVPSLCVLLLLEESPSI